MLLLFFLLLLFYNILGCTDSKKYSGTVAVTISGRTCQAWSNQKPHSHSYVDSHFQEGSMTLAKNYCRDPDGTGYVWCYTTDPDKRWEACNVDLCGKYTLQCGKYKW